MLRRVARLGTGHTPSRQVPEYWERCTIPWLTLADVGQLRDGRTQVITDTANTISELGLANSAAEIHPAGTVALSRTASVGFSCVLGRDMATSQDFVTWTCGPAIEPRYLLWVLRGTVDEILGLRTGSTHKTIYMPDIETIRVPLPPIDAQRRIADYLDAETARIDALIEKKRRMTVLLDEWFTAEIDAAVRAAGGEHRPLGHLTPATRQIMYGIVLPGPHFEGGVLLVKGGDVEHARLSPEVLNRTDPTIEAAYARSRLAAGDVVIAIRGGIGAVAIVPSEIEGANITQDVARIRPARGIDAQWLYYVLMSTEVRDQIQARVTGATIRGINIWDLKRVRVPVPPESTRSEIAAQLTRLDQERLSLDAKLDRQIALLQEHRQALITAAVTGELEIAA
jgi:type I restriction enzyme S subunit